MIESFPRQQARTRRFSLGVPRSFRVSPDGSRVVFLRSQSGTDSLTCLWQLHVATGQEELVADPAALDAAEGELPAAEKARRERAREQAGGIVGYATNSDLRVAVFTLGGRVFLAELAELGSPAGPPQQVGAHAPAHDARPDPAGRLIGYVSAGALHVLDTRTGQDRVLASPDGQPGLSFGLAEFIAAEEMGRLRGYWWAPDSSAILTARVDERPVQRWHIADPANPGRPPAEIRYPAAGTANADVSLLLARLDGSQAAVHWDRAAFEYLVAVDWSAGDPLIVVQSRDQRRMQLLQADPATGRTTLIREDTDPKWVDIVTGVPARTSDGRIAWTAAQQGACRLLLGTAGEHRAGTAPAVTPATMQVRDVLGTDQDTVLFTASGPEPTEIGLWRYCPSTGLGQVSPPGGVHGGTRSGGTTVLVSRTLAEPGARTETWRDTEPDRRIPVASLAARPHLPAPRPDLFPAGPRQVRTALLLPSWHRPGSARLPVLLDPYGGPHSQRVLAAQDAFLTSQWLAEQGFAVLVADGRGTPGRGPEWDRAVWHDLAGPVLEDQVSALHAAAQRNTDLDLSRVAIRGWSFGGYLAALAVLRRPDVFHAAVAGAPVTDWALYDTHYTERYLGDPGQDPAPYQDCSLIRAAPGLSRPLQLIHGLADDNVVVAHTLRLSAALLAAGRPHCVLPLSGVTHMTPQEEVAENLLLLQVDFLGQALGQALGMEPAQGKHPM
ncbi:MAG TPA: prolyl oligopeptidase family serine peptidase [Streptosporangiaceae bacterium]|nr:prolyl oligopeptidase family serine peptidase [Streptosporangiaceae bacterium]